MPYQLRPWLAFSDFSFVSQLKGGLRSGYVNWSVALTAWATALVFSFHLATSWDFKPGPGAVRRPKPSVGTREPLLIVVLHSQCPCSLATVENLIDLPGSVLAHLKIHLVFTGPDPRNSPVDSRARVLENVEREYSDEADVLARFGAQTSGQAYLYNRRGDLVFTGGLTDSRGHEGESSGVSAIQRTVAGQPCAPGAPVFGCALQTRRNQ
jgi:hypothetical protein